MKNYYLISLAVAIMTTSQAAPLPIPSTDITSNAFVEHLPTEDIGQHFATPAPVRRAVTGFRKDSRLEYAQAFSDLNCQGKAGKKAKLRRYIDDGRDPEDQQWSAFDVAKKSNSPKARKSVYITVPTLLNVCPVKYFDEHQCYRSHVTMAPGCHNIDIDTLGMQHYASTVFLQRNDDYLPTKVVGTTTEVQGQSQPVEEEEQPEGAVSES